MSFDRTRLPDALDYFASQELALVGPGKWKTTRCTFHGGSDSMRINTASGGWCCMSCGEKGGDVLAYHMRASDMDFIDACKALGAWVDDGKPFSPNPAPLPARQALEVMHFECLLAAVAAGNVAQGVELSDNDRARLMVASNRITRLAEAYR